MYPRLITMLLTLTAMAWAVEVVAQEEPESEGLSGKTRNCINTRRIRRTYIVDDRNLLFYLGTRTVLLNTTQNQCPGLKRTGIFSWNTNSGVLCSGDGIAGGRDAWGPTRPVPRCQLGKFLQISREDADALREPVAVAPASEPMPVTESLPMPSPSEVGAETEEAPKDPE